MAEKGCVSWVIEVGLGWEKGVGVGGWMIFGVGKKGKRF